MADVADGLFDVADGVLKVVQAPAKTAAMLAQLAEVLHRARLDKLPMQEAQRQVQAVDPEAAALLARTPKGFFWTAVLLMIVAIKACNPTIKVDAKITIDGNKLVDQLRDRPPASVSPQPERGPKQAEGDLEGQGAEPSSDGPGNKGVSDDPPARPPMSA